MKAFIIATLLAIAAVLPFTGCKQPNRANDAIPSAGDTLTSEAALLTIVDHGDYTSALISNPWDSAAPPLQTLLLVPANRPLPQGLPQGTIIKVPLTNSLVFSSVHAGAIDELGAAGAIKGVCDAAYFKIPAIAGGLADGSIIDAGNSMSPSIERIMLLGPDAILRSPYQNSTAGALETAGIPIIECADYMETTPLGRAEWIKLLGELYGHRDKAATIYDNVAAAYNNIKDKAAAVTDRPKVISETVTDGVWYIPGGNSYMARLFIDAGADYPWSDNTSTGSLPLDFQAVYDKAADADVWLVKSYGKDMTLDALRSIYPLNDRFKAFASGGVYACNTATATLFEDFPFHPEKLLAEYYRIFHPEANDGENLYFKKVN